jgi:serine/threonine protein kinase
MEKQQRHLLVEQLFQAALALPPDERTIFLASSCEDDPDLLDEVRSLISADEKAQSFLSAPALRPDSTSPLNHNPQTMTGRSFGQYEILQLLGRGGMGEVYRARDTRLARDVAIKFVPADLASDESRLRRLEREARLLASLNHPNIATIYGLEYFGDARLLVMERCEGETLDEMIARGPIAAEKVLAIFRQIGEALEAAHARGVIHRDLKPSNIKLTPDGKVKLLDFGIAKSLDLRPTIERLRDEPATSLSESGLIVGTPGYMSPEQARGEAVDKRTDIWAFGVVMYEAMSGERAFRGSSLAEVFGNILHREPDWTLIPADAPSRFGRLIRQCLRKDAASRPQQMAEVLAAIQESITSPIASMTVEFVEGETGIDSQTTYKQLSPDTPVSKHISTLLPKGAQSTAHSRPRSFRFHLLARPLPVELAALLALALAVAVWWMWKGRSGGGQIL